MQQKERKAAAATMKVGFLFTCRPTTLAPTLHSCNLALYLLSSPLAPAPLSITIIVTTSAFMLCVRTGDAFLGAPAMVCRPSRDSLQPQPEIISHA